jgi:hypothetical protein
VDDLLGKFASWLTALPRFPEVLKYGSLAPGKQRNEPPKSLVSDFQEQKAVDYPHAKRVKIRYGPFRAPPRSEKSEASDLWNTPGLASAVVYNQKRPCEGQCAILTLYSDLEYADGSLANDTTGVSHQCYGSLSGLQDADTSNRRGFTIR